MLYRKLVRCFLSFESRTSKLKARLLSENFVYQICFLFYIYNNYIKKMNASKYYHLSKLYIRLIHLFDIAN